MKKAGRIYVLVVQGLIEMVVLVFAFYFIGYYLIGKDSVWNGILAVLGGLLGLGIFIKRIITVEGKNERVSRNQK